MSLAGLMWLASRCVLDCVGAAALPRSPALPTVSSVGGVACPPQWLPVLLAFGNLPTPDPINGEEACEGHGYGKARCKEVGCCQYAEGPAVLPTIPTFSTPFTVINCADSPTLSTCQKTSLSRYASK